MSVILYINGYMMPLSPDSINTFELITVCIGAVIAVLHISFIVYVCVQDLRHYKAEKKRRDNPDYIPVPTLLGHYLIIKKPQPCNKAR